MEMAGRKVRSTKLEVRIKALVVDKSVLFRTSYFYLRIFLVAFFILPKSLYSQPAHPFPAHVAYFPGTIKPNNVSQKQMDDSVRTFYNAWKQRYLNHGCNENEYYVWFELPGKECVSEGQGYGMMIVALLAGYDTAAKTIYDGLYRYYRSHLSKKNDHLMAWA